MLKKDSLNNNVFGKWKIIWMEMWDDEYINIEAPGYINIDSEGNGEFQFGLVSGSFNIDATDDYFDSKWSGADENDEAYGDIDGRIEYIDQKENLDGIISFWNGDESEYKAVRI